MKSTALKITRIGNSRGVRLPAATPRRYGIGTEILMEEKSEGILLRPLPVAGEKLSWQDTARAMIAEAEGWEEWDSLASDGLEGIPWEGRAAAEDERTYKPAFSRPPKK